MGGSNRRKGARRPERGYMLLAVFIVALIVSVGLINSAAAVAMGTVSARRAREASLVRQAAGLLAGAPPATTDGGSLYPEPPREGWSDIVWADEEHGTFLVLEPGTTAPAAAVVISRQWRISSPSGAPRRLECTAVLLDPATGRPAGRLPVVRYRATDLE